MVDEWLTIHNGWGTKELLRLTVVNHSLPTGLPTSAVSLSADLGMSEWMRVLVDITRIFPTPVIGKSMEDHNEPPEKSVWSKITE